MLKQFKYRDVVWLDLEAPTANEIQNLGQQYKVHPLFLAELDQVSASPRIDVYPDSIYLTLPFPTSTGRQDVAFVISPHFIITAHHETVQSLNDFAKIFEQNNGHAGFVFFYMLREIYAAIEANLAELNHRQVLDYQWTLRSHQAILESFALAGLELFGLKFNYYLQTIRAAERRLWHTLEQSRANFQDQRLVQQSLTLNKINKNLQILLIVVAVFFVAFVIIQVKLLQ